MKAILIKICWPILKFFETEAAPANVKKSHRVALNAMGVLFLFLSCVSVWATSATGNLGSLIPVIVFAAVGVVAIVVGSLGSDGAVSKIWGAKK